MRDAGRHRAGRPHGLRQRLAVAAVAVAIVGAACTSSPDPPAPDLAPEGDATDVDDEPFDWDGFDPGNRTWEVGDSDCGPIDISFDLVDGAGVVEDEVGAVTLELTPLGDPDDPPDQPFGLGDFTGDGRDDAVYGLFVGFGTDTDAIVCVVVWSLDVDDEPQVLTLAPTLWDQDLPREEFFTPLEVVDGAVVGTSLDLADPGADRPARLELDPDGPGDTSWELIVDDGS